MTSSGIVAEKSSVCRAAESGSVCDDAADVGPEAHVHHAVRFVEHERVELVEADGLAAHVIHQPAGSRDDDVDAGLERALLRPHVDAAVDRDAGDVGVIDEALDVVFDLHGELARRREDEDARVAALFRRGGARPAASGSGSAAGTPPSCRCRCRRSRSRSSPLMTIGNDRALNRRGRGEAADADAFDERGLEAERVEADRPRIVCGLRPSTSRVVAGTWKCEPSRLPRQRPRAVLVVPVGRSGPDAVLNESSKS